MQFNPKLPTLREVTRELLSHVEIILYFVYPSHVLGA